MDRGAMTDSAGAFGDVIARAYPALRRVAAARAAGTGLSPSSLVQDTLCRMLRMAEPPKSEDEVQAAAFGIMKWVLIDRLRSEKSRDKREASAGRANGEARNGDHTHSAEAHGKLRADPRLEHLAAALSALADGNPRKAEVMTLSAVCGLTNVRIAELLAISEKTVQRDLEFARAWIASYRPSETS